MTIFLIFLGIVVALFVLGIVFYNKIVALKNRVDNAWQTIDAQLQRRYDLIPNIVSTVKGYAKHESETLAKVTEARANATSAATPEDKMQADNMLTGALRQLLAVSENYPDLKANQNFIDLQEQLQDTEDKIVYARQSFNDCVLNYNNAIQQFPGNIIASLFGFKEKQGFVVDSEGARTAPKVEF